MTAACVYVIYEAGNFAPALDLCVALKQRGTLVPILFSPYFLPDTERYMATAAAHGIAYVHEPTALGGDADPLGQLRAAGFDGAAATPATGTVDASPPSLRQRLGRWLLRRLQDAAAQWLLHYRARIAVARAFLAQAGARVLVLPEDNVERDSACWVHAIHALGGSAQVVSYGSITPHEAAIAYFDNPDYRVGDRSGRLFCRLHPKWTMRYRGRQMIRLPLPRIAAMENLGLAPGNPWVVNTGTIDGIVVESEFMCEQFALHGIERTRLHPLGHSAFDLLADAALRRDDIRRAWQAANGHDDTRPVLLCAMPPDQWPSKPAAGFDGYASLIDGWLDALRKAGSHFFTVISPHPNIAPAHVARMRDAGFTVLDGGVASWLPACDLYVASVSSTIKWAGACGKPVLNYDCYDYDFADYRNARNVLTVRTIPDFEAALARYGDAAHLATVADASRQDSSHWGAVDGLAMQRLLAHIERAAGSSVRANS